MDGGVLLGGVRKDTPTWIDVSMQKCGGGASYTRGFVDIIIT